MLTKEQVLNLELAEDALLVKSSHEIRKSSGIILDDRSIEQEVITSYDYEVIKVHPNCFPENFFTNGKPQVGDTVVVNKFDARLIFKDENEYQKGNSICKDRYYILKNTNIQAFVKKGE